MPETGPPVVVAHRDSESAQRYAGWLPDGYEVHVVPPDLVAVARASDDLAVLVLDWGLPPGSRQELLLGLHERGIDPGVLAIAEGIPEADPIDTGAHNYLLTPVNRSEFTAAVEDVHLQWLYDRRLNDYLDTAIQGRPDGGAAGTITGDDPAVREAKARADDTLDDLSERMPFSTLFRTLIDD